jgi:SAM-dependent methyltransferase
VSLERACVRAGVGMAAAMLAACSILPPPDIRLDAPYVSTPYEVVDEMLRMADAGPGDVLYDLGCGDGRIVVAAAKERGARGVGIDIDPERIAEAKANASRAGVGKRVEFREADLFRTDLSPASVVTLYLLPHLNMRLRPQLWRQLKIGSRVVSHDFNMGEWEPEREERIGSSTIMLWTIRQKHKTAVA